MKKKINLALQGGGAHGAFTWGVLETLLDDNRLEIEGVSGCSAGSMNAVILADGLRKNGSAGAIEGLGAFWSSIAELGEAYGNVGRLPWEIFMLGNAESTLSNQMMRLILHTFSPYQLNPNNINPLRAVLLEHVDFDCLRQSSPLKLWLTATNVETGKARVFETSELSVDVVLASACLPTIFQAVEIDGQFYWDGGYMGNPVLYPLIYGTVSQDIVILHINPIHRPGPPKTSDEIANRINEISFNTSLIKELRAIYFVQHMVKSDWIKPEHRDKLKDVYLHSVRSDESFNDLSITSKLLPQKRFLNLLRQRGQMVAAQWLAANYDALNQHSSVDLAKEFL